MQRGEGREPAVRRVRSVSLESNPFTNSKTLCWNDQQYGPFHYIPLEGFVFLEITADQISFLKQWSSCQCCLCVCKSTRGNYFYRNAEKRGESSHSYGFSTNIISERSGSLENLEVIWQYIKDEISDRISSKQAREKDEPLALGKFWCAFLQFPEKIHRLLHSAL